MLTQDFDYFLPEELIAQQPLKDRSSSRLLTLIDGEVSHKTFKDVLSLINSGDCLVVNNTRVIPARLYGTKEKTGGFIEFLLLKRIELDIWEVALRPGKRAKVGARFVFGGMLTAEVLEVIEDGGNRIVKFEYDGVFEEILDALGEMPLPHYITQKLEDKERYQTVYSKNPGSAAAPTAGLHFTNELLSEIEKKGADIAYLTLHVGLGTFRPVKEENIQRNTLYPKRRQRK